LPALCAVERIARGCSAVFRLSLSDLAAVRIRHHRVLQAKSVKVRDIEEVIENLHA
jgi:hypothetical protein